MNKTTARILIGLGLGILVGLFFGDYAAPFKYVADVYLRLLQMTVLPYVIVSVIAGFGALDGSKARILWKRNRISTSSPCIFLQTHFRLWLIMLFRRWSCSAPFSA